MEIGLQSDRRPAAHVYTVRDRLRFERWWSSETNRSQFGLSLPELCLEYGVRGAR